MATPLDTIGLSFSPTGQGQANDPSAQGDQGNLSPIQSAIKILSLRVPKNAGPGGIAPNALLTSPGGAAMGGMGGGMDLMAMLKRLFQPGPVDALPMAPQQPAGQMPSPTVPPPHVIPGNPPTAGTMLKPPSPTPPAGPPSFAPPGIGRGPFSRVG